MADELNRAAPIAAQLDQDAERAAFEAWTRADIGMPDNVPFNWDSHWAKAALEGWLERARRAAPAVAQPDAELPPLPEPFCKVGTGESGMWAERGADGGEPVYTAAQVEQIRAPYAERIRLLEREAAGREGVKRAETRMDAGSQPVVKLGQSIDTPEFRALFRGLIGHDGEVWPHVIACIDGHTAGTAPEGWKLVPVEPTDEMRTACRVLNYADDIDAEWSRMIAAAPSPQENTNEN